MAQESTSGGASAALPRDSPGNPLDFVMDSSGNVILEEGLMVGNEFDLEELYVCVGGHMRAARHGSGDGKCRPLLDSPYGPWGLNNDSLYSRNTYADQSLGLLRSGYQCGSCLLASDSSSIKKATLGPAHPPPASGSGGTDCPACGGPMPALEVLRHFQGSSGRSRTLGIHADEDKTLSGFKKGEDFTGATRDRTFDLGVVGLTSGRVLNHEFGRLKVPVELGGRLAELLRRCCRWTALWACLTGGVVMDLADRYCFVSMVEFTWIYDDATDGRGDCNEGYNPLQQCYDGLGGEQSFNGYVSRYVSSMWPCITAYYNIGLRGKSFRHHGTSVWRRLRWLDTGGPFASGPVAAVLSSGHEDWTSMVLPLGCRCASLFCPMFFLYNDLAGWWTDRGTSAERNYCFLVSGRPTEREFSQVCTGAASSVLTCLDTIVGAGAAGRAIALQVLGNATYSAITERYGVVYHRYMSRSRRKPGASDESEGCWAKLQLPECSVHASTGAKALQELPVLFNKTLRAALAAALGPSGLDMEDRGLRPASLAEAVLCLAMEAADMSSVVRGYLMEAHKLVVAALNCPLMGERPSSTPSVDGSITEAEAAAYADFTKTVLHWSSHAALLPGPVPYEYAYLAVLCLYGSVCIDAGGPLGG